MTQKHFYSPGQLLANIPGLLGFFPTESIIIMAFHAELADAADGSGITFALGPTVRVDIDDCDDLMDDAARAINSVGTDLNFAFIVSRRPERELDAVAEKLYEMHSTHDIEIDACWHVPEIRTGETYDLWFGRDLSGASTSSQTWMSGQVPVVAESRTMKDCAENGAMPAMTRSDALRPMVEINPHFTPYERLELTHACKRAAKELRAHGALRTQDSCYFIDDVALDARYLLEELATDGTRWEEMRADAFVMYTLGVWLSASCLRDRVLAEFLDQPKPAQELLLAVAQTFDGVVRANALCLYSAVLIALRQESRAGLALTTVLNEFPEHRLGNLMIQLYRIGHMQEMLAKLTKGSRLAQQAAEIAA